MNTTFGAWMLAVAMTVAVAPCAAAGWGAVLGQGPSRDFNDADVRLFLDALRQTAEASGEPQPVSWRNPATGAGGTFQVIGQPKVKGYAECRRLRVEVHSKKQAGTPAFWTTCKDASGRWVLVGAG